MSSKAVKLQVIKYIEA